MGGETSRFEQVFEATVEELTHLAKSYGAVYELEKEDTEVVDTLRNPVDLVRERLKRLQLQGSLRQAAMDALAELHKATEEVGMPREDDADAAGVACLGAILLAANSEDGEIHPAVLGLCGVVVDIAVKDWPDRETRERKWDER